jgi:hypothetical protein
LAHAKFVLEDDDALAVIAQAEDVTVHCDLAEEARMHSLIADIKHDADDIPGCIEAWRQAAQVYDRLGDLTGLKEACEELTRLCDDGPAVFYAELLKRITALIRLKTDELPPLLMPVNPPGRLQRGLDVTPKKRKRSSRISAGGLPMLSPWKPSLADVSP